MKFTERVRRFLIRDVPPNANTLSIHVIYKIAENDNHTLRLKARTDPHGNENSVRMKLLAKFCMCSPTVTRIIISLATI